MDHADVEWLTSDGLPVLVAIIGILSGVAGGVASQLVAGYFNARGETRQLSAAQQRWREEQQFEREKVLFDKRREVFTNYLQALERATEVLKLLHQHGQETKDQLTVRQMAKERLDELYVIGTEIRLIAPAVREPAYHAYFVAKKVQDADPDPVESPGLIQELRDQRRAIREAMTAALGIAEEEPAA